MRNLSVIIAKKEFKSFFHTPIGWILLIFFWIYCAYIYWSYFSVELKGQILFEELPGLTFTLFGAYHGLFSQVARMLFCFVPILTMNIMTQEYRVGSVKLLQASPIPTYAIYIGKYVALLCYAGLMITILGVYVFLTFLFVENADLFLMLNGLLGIFLMLCSYIAIGLFMSVVSNYALISALGTFVILTVLTFIGDFGQNSDMMREIAYWCSLRGRAENFIAGIFSLSDILYFIILAIFFLSMSVCYGKFKYNNVGKIKRLGYIICFILFFGGINYFFSDKYISFLVDVSEDKRNSLSIEGEKLMSAMKGGFEIVSYTNIFSNFFGVAAPNQRMSDIERFNKLRLQNPRIDFHYVYYAKELSLQETPPMLLSSKLSFNDKIEHVCNVMKLSHDDITPWQVLSDSILCAEEDYRFFRKLIWQGREEILRVYDDRSFYPSETEIMVSIRRLLENGGVRLCLQDGVEGKSFYDIEGEGFSRLFSEKRIRQSLINQGFDCVVNQDSLADIIVVALQKKLSEFEQQWLEVQLANGKNMLILCDDKGYSDFLLDNLGIEKSLGCKKEIVTALSETTELAKNSPFITGESQFFFPNAYHLSFTTTDMNMIKTFFKDDVGLYLENKGQKIIVIGDSDFMTNRYLNSSGYQIYYDNLNLAKQLFYWLSEGKYPMKLTYQTGKVNYIDLSIQEANICRVVFLYILSLLGILMSFMILRKR